MNRPHVHINVAMTADGKIDTIERKGVSISSTLDKQRVDRLRAESDAVLVGGHTLLDEDPKLTVKSSSLRDARVSRGLPPNPAKVGVVTRAELKLDSSFLTAGPAYIYLFTTSKSSPSQVESLKTRGVEVIVHSGESVDLEAMLNKLSVDGINQLLVEGGGILNFELLQRRLVDELTIYLAPVVFGGRDAPTLADGIGLTSKHAVPLVLDHVENFKEGGVLMHYHL